VPRHGALCAVPLATCVTQAVDRLPGLRPRPRWDGSLAGSVGTNPFHFVGELKLVVASLALEPTYVEGFARICAHLRHMEHPLFIVGEVPRDRY